jgi:hypothetical protein
MRALIGHRSLRSLLTSPIQEKSRRMRRMSPASWVAIT